MQQPQWGGIALPAPHLERVEFVKQLLRQYTQLQIEGFPELKYLQQKYVPTHHE